jgi:hypothetical protein
LSSLLIAPDSGSGELFIKLFDTGVIYGFLKENLAAVTKENLARQIYSCLYLPYVVRAAIL